MPLFFLYELPIAGSIDIVALTGVTAYLTYIWSQVDQVAAWCLAPYIGWLCFASYLSIGIGQLNNWNFRNKHVNKPPTTKGAETKYVNEKPEGKAL